MSAQELAHTLVEQSLTHKLYLKMVRLATPAMLCALATLSPVSIMTCSASSCLARFLNRRPNTGNQPSHLAGPLVRQLPRCSASKAAALLLLT